MDINTHGTLKTNLAAYWTLDANFNDSHSGAHHGAFYNAPTFPVAKLRTGAKFVASSSQYGKVTDHADFQGATCSYAFWFKVDAIPSSSQYLLSHIQGGTFARNVQIDSSGTIHVTFPDSFLPVTVPSMAPIVAGQWYHLLAFQGGGVVAFYLNNVDQGTIPAFSVAGVSADLYIGSTPTPGQYFDGIIDDFGWWNKILSSGERNDLYQSGIGITWDGTFTSIVTHPTLRSGLLAHYKMNGNANDTLGNYNGTPQNSPTYATGKINQAIELNGSNQYVDLGYHAGLNPDYISVCAWMKRDATPGYSGPIGKRGALGHSYDLGFDGTLMGFYCKNEGGTAVPVQINAIVDGVWQFWAGVFDGSAVKLSANGGAFSTAALSGKLNKNTQPTYIGRLEGYAYVDGCLDEITIHDRPLLLSEIQDLYNSGSGLPYAITYAASKDITSNEYTLKTNLAAYFTLDSGLQDSQSGAHHGTLIGSPTYPIAKLRTGMKLNGVDEYGRIPTHADFSGSNLGYSFWFKARDLIDGATVYSRGYAGAGDYVRFRLVDVGSSVFKLKAMIRGGGNDHDLATTTSILAETYYHVMVNYDSAGSMNLYLNGVEEATISASGHTPSISGDLFIGCNFTSSGVANFFPGVVDDFGFWTKALSSDERDNIWNSGTGITWDATHTSVMNHPTLMRGLLVAYKLDSSGDDAMPNGLNGIQQGNVTYVAGKQGNAANFAADGNFRLPATDPTFDLDHITVSCWTKPTSLINWAGIVTKATYNGGGVQDQHCWGIRLNGGASNKYVFSTVVGTTYSEVTDPEANATGVWAHLAGTYDGSYSRLWKNGVNAASSALVSGVLNKLHNLPVFIGTRCADSSPPTFSTSPHTGERYNGAVDEVLIWNRALAASELSDLYNSGTGLPLGTPYVESFKASSIIHHPTLPDSLIAYYKLDGNANDSHVNGLNGTAVGTPTWPTSASYCRLRQALQLNGTSQYISIPDNARFTPTTGMSVGGWFWIDSTGASTWQVLVNKYYWGSPWTNKSWEMEFNLSTNTLGAQIVWGPTLGVDYWAVTKGSLSALKNSWNHLAFTYDKSNLILYVNGFEVARTAGCSGNPLPNAVPIYIGSYWNQDNTTRYYSKGYFDEITIAARAWTPKEVLDLYHSAYPLRYNEVYIDQSASIGGTMLKDIETALIAAPTDPNNMTSQTRPWPYAINRSPWTWSGLIGSVLDEKEAIQSLPDQLLKACPDILPIRMPRPDLKSRYWGTANGLRIKGRG